MIAPAFAVQHDVPAIMRLAALAPLDDAAMLALGAAVRRPRTFRQRREIRAEGSENSGILLILGGWGARVRLLEDGRRQILHFLLPGDLVGSNDPEHPVASATVIAFTDVDVCAAPHAAALPALRQAYGISRAYEEAYLLAQITRLGRLNAYERIADLLIDLYERLSLAGLVTDRHFRMPLTQETIADALGLTSVHVNRTLQAMRRDGSLSWKGRDLALADPSALARSIGRSDIAISHRHA